MPTSAEISYRISDDAVSLMQTGEIRPEDHNGLAQYVVDRLSAEYPNAPLPGTLCPFSLLVGAVVGRAITLFEQDQ